MRTLAARDTRGHAGELQRRVARIRSARTITSTTSGSCAAASRTTRRRSTTPTARRGCPTPTAGGSRSARNTSGTPNCKFDAGFVYIFADSPRSTRTPGSTRDHGLINGNYDARRTILGCRRPTRSDDASHDGGDRGARLVPPAASFLPRPRLQGACPSRHTSDPDHVATRRYPVRKAAVLGAGVMGAQIAAHLANADVPVVLFDLPAKEGDAERHRAQGDRRTSRKLEPAPLARARTAPAAIDAGQLRQRPARCSRECDLVIEAIAERMDWKQDLYAKVAPHVAAARDPRVEHVGAVARRAVGRACPKRCGTRFCGVHFFNPPRYMHLVELIPAPETDAGAARRARGVPHHDARQGRRSARRTRRTSSPTASASSRCWRRCSTRATFGLGFDEVDALTGPAIGRAKSATYRTADVVGLDTMAHVIKTMRDTLPDDPWHALFATPPVLAALVAQGRARRRRRRRASSARSGKDIQVLDPATRDYRARARRRRAGSRRDPRRSRSPAEKFAKLRASRIRRRSSCGRSSATSSTTARTTCATIADNARDVDLAIRWGFGWQLGPFETWQAAGWNEVAALDRRGHRRRQDAGHACRCPAWVQRRKVRGAAACTRRRARIRPRATRSCRAATLPVYARQRFPDPVLGERSPTAARRCSRPTPCACGTWATTSASCRSRPRCTRSATTVLDGLQRAIDEAETQLRGPGDLADEASRSRSAPTCRRSRPAIAGRAVGRRSRRWSRSSSRPSHAPAVQPRADGCGGARHGARRPASSSCTATRAVAALESYIGLVEAGVGLLPAGGGMQGVRGARGRGSEARRQRRPDRPFPFLRTYFQTIAMAKVAKSALEAHELGYLRAVRRRRHASRTSCCTSPRRRRARWPMPATGRRCRARKSRSPARPASRRSRCCSSTCGTAASSRAHDFEIGRAGRRVLCGGDVEPGSLVDEDWLLELERERLHGAAADEKTQARIAHMLATGKPLRN